MQSIRPLHTIGTQLWTIWKPLWLAPPHLLLLVVFSLGVVVWSHHALLLGAAGLFGVWCVMSWTYRHALTLMRDSPTPTAPVPRVARLTFHLGISPEHLTEVQTLVWASAHGTHPHPVCEHVTQVSTTMLTVVQWFWRIAVGYGVLVMSLVLVGALLRVATAPTPAALVSVVFGGAILVLLVRMLRADRALAMSGQRGQGTDSWGWGTEHNLGACSKTIARALKRNQHQCSPLEQLHLLKEELDAIVREMDDEEGAEET